MPMLMRDGAAAAVLFGGMVTGALCGMAPLIAALRLGRVVTACACFVLCVGAGAFGGLIVGVPAAFVLTGLVSVMGQARTVYPTVDPYARPDSRGEEQSRRAEPYMRLGQTIVCNECRTASPADATGRPHARCSGCGLPFREEDEPAARRRFRNDDIIDLKPAGRD